MVADRDDHQSQPQIDTTDCFDESALPQAVGYATHAAEQGDAKALRTLGFMYERGLGVTQDFERAVELWREYSLRGDA